MMGHNISFKEIICKIIPKLSLLLLLIWSTAKAFEMRCYQRLLNISDKDYVTNEDDCRNIQATIGEYDKLQGPVVQSIVSLMSSLRGQLVKCFTTL